MSAALSLPDVDLHKKISELGIDTGYATDAATTVFFKSMELDARKTLCSFLQTQLNSVIADAQYIRDRIPVFQG